MSDADRRGLDRAARAGDEEAEERAALSRCRTGEHDLGDWMIVSEWLEKMSGGRSRDGVGYQDRVVEQRACWWCFKLEHRRRQVAIVGQSTQETSPLLQAMRDGMGGRDWTPAIPLGTTLTLRILRSELITAALPGFIADTDDATTLRRWAAIYRSDLMPYLDSAVIVTDPIALGGPTVIVEFSNPLPEPGLFNRGPLFWISPESGRCVGEIDGVRCALIAFHPDHPHHVMCTVRGCGIPSLHAHRLGPASIQSDDVPPSPCGAMVSSKMESAVRCTRPTGHPGMHDGGDDLRPFWECLGFTLSEDPT